MNYKELLKAVEEYYENLPEEEADYDEPIDNFAYDEGGRVLNEEIGWMKEVHQEGGSGQGEHWESVKHFPKHDIYIQITGFYTSGNGVEFDGWEDDCAEVKPQKKTITVYE